jgi:uncharacterized protein (DUF1697 family)
MIKKSILLLRGINVGGKNILPMKELVALLNSIGCENVQTYIQSGNVVLDSDFSSVALKKRVESEIEKVKGFKVQVFVLSQGDFEDALNASPYVAAEGKLIHFFFMAKTPTKTALSSLEKLRAPSERYELKGQVLYLLAPDGIGKSKLVLNVEKTVECPTTARNWNKVQKLLHLSTQ